MPYPHKVEFNSLVPVLYFMDPQVGHSRWVHKRRMCVVKVRLEGYTQLEQHGLTVWFNNVDKCVGCGKYINFKGRS
jgi:hypothetical protein